MTAIIVDNIKRLGLREFQRAMYEHIRNPEAIILEKFKKPHLVLLPYKEYLKLREASLPGFHVTKDTTQEPMIVPRSAFLTVPLGDKDNPTAGEPLTFWQHVKKILNTKLF